MDYIIKNDNYDELLKAEKIRIVTHTFIEKRAELRKEFSSSVTSGTPFIDGETELPEGIINISFEFFPDTLGIEDVVLVHVTNMFPENGIIKCAKDRILETTGNKKIKINQHRTTTHFALNGRVGNNDGGNWDHQKIVIIEPIISHMDKIANISTGDTFMVGDIKLSDKAVILVHESIYDTIPKDVITKYNVVKFSGSNTIATNKMLLILGYKPQEVDSHGWVNTKNDEDIRNCIKNNYPNISFGVHTHSKLWYIEKHLQSRDIDLATLRNVDYLDTANGLNDITIDEINELWHTYINSRRNEEEGEELDFELFVEFCMTRGITITEDRKITFLNAEETQKVIDNKRNYLNNNINLYRQLFESITINKLFEYVGNEEKPLINNLYSDEINNLLHNMYTFWCRNNHENIITNNKTPEEIEKEIRTFLKNRFKALLERYKKENGYQIEKGSNNSIYSPKKYQEVNFQDAIIDSEIEKRINSFLEEEKMLNQEFINLISMKAQAGFSTIYEHLEHIYNTHCQDYGNLDSPEKEKGARLRLMYRMQNILANYIYDDDSYAIRNEENLIIKKLPKKNIDIEIKKLIDIYIQNKKINDQKRSR